jgi:thiol-disulfide isomerase/thioredoxin
MFPRPRHAQILSDNSDPRHPVSSDLASEQMSAVPETDEPYFLALVASWCGHCQVKVDFMNNVNTIHKLSKLKNNKETYIPRVEWIDAHSVNQGVKASENQRNVLRSLKVGTNSFPKWYLSVARNKPLIEVPGRLLSDAANESGMQALRAFYRSQA